MPVWAPDRSLLGHDTGPDRAPGRAAHVRAGDDQGDPEAAHGRRDRAGLRRGRAAAQDRSADRGAARGGAGAGDHLLPDEDRRRAPRRPAPRPRPAGEGAPWRHDPGPARRGDDLVQGAQPAAARGHRRRRPRARHRARHPRDQLRPAEQHRDLRAPDRAHGTGWPDRACDHLRDPETARRDPADRARGADGDRRVGAPRGTDRTRPAPPPARPLGRGQASARARDGCQRPSPTARTTVT